MRRPLVPVLLLAGLSAGCSSVSYDLSKVPFPVYANPTAYPDTPREAFEISEKAVLWVHGLFGEDQPDIAELLRQECGEDCSGVVNFRVDIGASGHDWFLTHLTLSLVRMKTVTIRGEKLAKKS